MHGPMVPFCSIRCSVVVAVALLFGSVAAPAQKRYTTMSITPAAGTKTMIGIQYEQWFYGAQSWETAESIPFLGTYTTDESTVDKHYEMFKRLDFDWLMIDWSNMLWAKPAWEEHKGDTSKLEGTTDVLFTTAAHRRARAAFAPKLVFLVGLRNGPVVPDGVKRLNGELRWIEAHYLDKPENTGSFLIVDGKPLLTILYWPPDPCSQLPQDLQRTALHAERWTVRWVASQLQDNHAELCGMWSWMDGVIPQIVTRNHGRAENIVVTPSSFQLPGRGWTDPSAISRDHGVPYLRSWKLAFLERPRFLEVHQWNEFTGQKIGRGLPLDYWGTGKPAASATKEVFADEYDVPLSDDIEPTRPDSCGYRGCGGWGFYYVNLTKALVSLYRGETPNITVLALSGPTSTESGIGKTVHLEWDFVGTQPKSYSLWLDGKQVRQGLEGNSTDLDAAGWKAGSHMIELRAAGVYTLFNLDSSKETKCSATHLPVVSSILIHAK